MVGVEVAGGAVGATGAEGAGAPGCVDDSAGALLTTGALGRVSAGAGSEGRLVTQPERTHAAATIAIAHFRGDPTNMDEV